MVPTDGSKGSIIRTILTDLVLGHKLNVRDSHLHAASSSYSSAVEEGKYQTTSIITTVQSRKLNGGNLIMILIRQ